MITSQEPGCRQRGSEGHPPGCGCPFLGPSMATHLAAPTPHYDRPATRAALKGTLQSEATAPELLGRDPLLPQTIQTHLVTPTPPGLPWHVPCKAPNSIHVYVCVPV